LDNDPSRWLDMPEIVMKKETRDELNPVQFEKHGF
jgi:hypothetical protein